MNGPLVIARAVHFAATMLLTGALTFRCFVAAPVFQAKVGAALGTLTSREQRILRMRFGIGEKAEHTLEEVGQVFGVTRERIRQIEAKALGRLRHVSRSAQLRALVET